MCLKNGGKIVEYHRIEIKRKSYGVAHTCNAALNIILWDLGDTIKKTCIRAQQEIKVLFVIPSRKLIHSSKHTFHRFQTLVLVKFKTNYPSGKLNSSESLRAPNVATLLKTT